MPAPPPLYVICHVPKTAGQTLRRILKEELAPSEVFEMYHHIPVWDSLSKKQRPFAPSDYRAYLTQLGQENSRLRVIIGHQAFYGIHRFFERETRYVCFLREPTARIVSLYNYRCQVARDLQQNDALLSAIGLLVGIEETQRTEILAKAFPTVSPLDFNIYLQMQKAFLIEGAIPSFARWLERYNSFPSWVAGKEMVGHLSDCGFMDRKEGEDFRSALHRTLQRFFFVGLQEYFSEDCQSLFAHMGIHREDWSLRVNVSRTAPEPLGADLRLKAHKKNMRDHALYQLVSKNRFQNPLPPPEIDRDAPLH